MSGNLDKKIRDGVEKKFSRRNLLKGLAASSLASFSAEKIGVAESIPSIHDKTKDQVHNNLDQQTGHEQRASAEAHNEEEMSKGGQMLNIATAVPVSAAFSYHVLYEASGARKFIEKFKRAKNLGKKVSELTEEDTKDIEEPAALTEATASHILTWENLRLAGLFAYDHQTREKAAEESMELGKSFMVTGLLTMISDIAANIKVNPDALLNQKSEDYSLIKRPDFDSPLEQWESHLTKTNNDIVASTSRLAGISMVLAPCSTTFVSSSVANQVKYELTKVVFENKFSEAIVAAKKAGNPIDEIALREKMILATNESMADLTKIITVLSANAHGAYLAGNPPQAFAIIDMLSETKTTSDKMRRYSRDLATGAASSSLFTVTLFRHWLKKNGIEIDAKRVISEFSKAALSTFQELTEAVTTAPLSPALKSGQVRFGALGKPAKELNKLLNQAVRKGDLDVSDKEALAAALTTIVKELPAAKMQFQVSAWLDQKSDGIGVPPFSIELFQKLEDLVKTGEFNPVEAMLEILNSGGINEKTSLKGFQKIADVVERFSADQKVIELSGYFDKLTNKIAQQSSLSVEESPQSIVPASNTARVDLISNILKVHQESVKIGASKKGGVTKEMLTDLLTKKEVGKDLEKAIEADTLTGTKELNEVLATLTAIKDKKDAVPGFTEDEESHLGHHRHKIPLNLNHSSYEMLRALLNQLPVVSPLSELFSAAMIDENAGKELPSLPIISSMIVKTLVIDTGFSSFADNIAAYQLSKKILVNYFKKVFGNKVYEEYPDLLDWVDIVCKLVAMLAGSNTLIGNGANFNQEKLELIEDSSVPQGVTINRSNMKMEESFNKYGLMASLTSIALGTSKIMSIVKDIHAKKKT